MFHPPSPPPPPPPEYRADSAGCPRRGVQVHGHSDSALASKECHGVCEDSQFRILGSDEPPNKAWSQLTSAAEVSLTRIFADKLLTLGTAEGQNELNAVLSALVGAGFTRPLGEPSTALKTITKNLQHARSYSRATNFIHDILSVQLAALVSSYVHVYLSFHLVIECTCRMINDAARTGQKLDCAKIYRQEGIDAVSEGTFRDYYCEGTKLAHLDRQVKVNYASYNTDTDIDLFRLDLLSSHRSWEEGFVPVSDTRYHNAGSCTQIP